MNYIERYQVWCKTAPLCEGDLKKLKELSNDEEAIKSRFADELQFGTGGIRGIMGIGTNRMNTFTVRRTAQGLATWLTGSGLPLRCAIGYDSRHNSRRFAEICAVALAEAGVHVYVYEVLAPTPMVSFAVRRLGCGTGIVVSASHNASQYNGIKCYGPDGCQMTDEPAARVFEAISATPYFILPKLTFEEAIAQGSVEYISEEIWQEYYKTVLAERLTDEPAEVRVVYTPLHGTGNVPVRTVLGRIGAQVTVVPVQELPDGDFTTCEYPNPETEAAMQESYRLAAQVKPDLVLGTDPDCDRCAVAVPENGAFRKLSGNELGCLLLDYILGTVAEKNALPRDPVAVRSIVSTPMADKIAAKYGVRMRKVLTGFKYIGGEILKLEEAGEEHRFVFGFEESCGYLKGTYARDKDAVVASMLVCDLAAKLKREGMTLAQRLDALYAELGYHEAKVISVELTGPEAMQVAAKFMADFRAEIPASLAGQTVTEYTDYLLRFHRSLADGTEQPVELPKSNVIVLTLGEKGSVVLRPSGTEPKIKLYLTAVDHDKSAALALLSKIDEAMRAYLPQNA